MEAPSPFSPTLPLFQTSWDSTSLGLLKECAYKYHLQMHHNWSPKSRSLHLIFGGLYASGVERYAHHRASGLDHTTSTVRVIRWVLENAGERTPEGVWTYWTPPPDHKDANIKNLYTLLRSLVWNFEDREGSPFKTVILSNGRPAVELSFNFHAFDIEDEPVSLCGHMDEVVEADEQYWVKDDKTTKSPLGASYFANYTPDNQMSLYTIGGKIILEKPIRGVLVRAAQIGVNFTRFQTAQVPRPQAVLAEWLEDTRWWITQAHAMAKANYYPRNDKACNTYGGCPFRKVCAVSPSHREAWLQDDFEKRVWNPLDVRGDIS